MSTHRVTLVKTFTYVIDVDAADEEEAIQEAYAHEPRLCSHCSGWKEKWSVGDDGEWMTVEEYYGRSYDPKYHGVTVEPIDPEGEG